MILLIPQTQGVSLPRILLEQLRNIFCYHPIHLELVLPTNNHRMILLIFFLMVLRTRLKTRRRMLIHLI